MVDDTPKPPDNGAPAGVEGSDSSAQSDTAQNSTTEGSAESQSSVEASAPRSESAAPESAIQATGEVVDRVERKELAEKKKREAEEVRKAAGSAQGVSDKQVQKLGHLDKIKLRKRKFYTRLVSTILAVTIIYLLYVRLFTPWQGDEKYGVCKVYLERSVRFPDRMKLIELNEFDTSVRIWFKRVDPFGSHRMEDIRCYFKNDATSGALLLDKITIDRREEPYEQIEEFNKIMPLVLENLPSLDKPYNPLDKNLKTLFDNAAAARGGESSQ